MSKLIFVLFLLIPFSAFGHEVRPAYLEITEIDDNNYLLTWKTPMIGENRLGLTPEISGNNQISSSLENHRLDDSIIQRWQIRAEEGIRGKTLKIAGLSSTMTDVLVRATFKDNTTWVERLTPSKPIVDIPLVPSPKHVAWTYFGLGIEHILLGIDHLLFIFALLMILSGFWPLFKTITAFTVAHSITLGMSILGVIHLPIPPVEAIIALSIVFVALESIKGANNGLNIITRYPWVVAFVFGLIHGFGFASVLNEIGLPQNHIPMALFFFNIGVEIGQLAFVGVAIVLIKPLLNFLPKNFAKVPPYAIGSIAMFWVIQRIAAF